MKLSVLVPAYNLEKYIAECLVSLLTQKADFCYEVIVCDDASVDNTALEIRKLAAKYKHLKAIFKPQNQGLAANMQTLVEAASGEYIAYLDGDDLALPGKLQAQVDYLESHSDCQMVFHESDMFDSVTGQTIKLYSQSGYNWPHIPKRSSLEHLVRYGTYMQASSVMFRNHPHLIDTVDERCKIILDYPFYVLNAGYLNAVIDFMPEVLGRYRIHADSFGAQTQRSVTRREQSLADIIHTCERAKEFGISPEIINAGVCHHQFAAALYFLYRNEDEKFNYYIEASAGVIFNERHQIAWENRHHPEQARVLLQKGNRV